MATTRFKGETAGERLDLSGISDSDMIQLRHQPGTIEDADKGISKSQLLSCPFGVSDTAASTGAKVASLTDSNPDFTLVSGREVVVCFTTANSASNPTLNFAGSGAIPIYYPNGQAVGAWPAETWMHLKYFYATVGNSQIQRWILLSPILVDVVAANNMNSVTSNAVAQALSKCFPKYSQAQLIYGGTSEYNDFFVAPDDGYLIGSGYGEASNSSWIYFYLPNNVKLLQQGVGSENICNCAPVKKGDNIRIWCYFKINNQGVYFVPCD